MSERLRIATWSGPRNDLAPFLAASDLFVLPSAYEANALVVLEALASGLPVVSTPVGFAGEIVQHGVNGFLVDRDPGDVGERMQQLAELDWSELAEWRRRARLSAEPYGWRAIARRYLALAEELLAERSDRQPGTAGAADARAGG